MRNNNFNSNYHDKYHLLREGYQLLYRGNLYRGVILATAQRLYCIDENEVVVIIIDGSYLLIDEEYRIVYDLKSIYPEFNEDPKEIMTKLLSLAKQIDITDLATFVSNKINMIDISGKPGESVSYQLSEVSHLKIPLEMFNCIETDESSNLLNIIGSISKIEKHRRPYLTGFVSVDVFNQIFKLDQSDLVIVGSFPFLSDLEFSEEEMNKYHINQVDNSRLYIKNGKIESTNHFRLMKADLSGDGFILSRRAYFIGDKIYYDYSRAVWAEYYRKNTVGYLTTCQEVVDKLRKNSCLVIEKEYCVLYISHCQYDLNVQQFCQLVQQLCQQLKV